MKKWIAAVGVAAVLLAGMTACGQCGISTELESLTAANSGSEASEKDTSGNAVLENDVFDSRNVENKTTVILPNGAVSSLTESAYEVEIEPDGGSADPEQQTSADGFHSSEQATESAQSPHAHYYVATIVAPTCTEGGYTEHTCTCGESYRDDYTTALGHSFTDEVIPPTTTSQGYTRHTCLRCAYVYEDSYTNPIRETYDLNAAMSIGNAYALSLGFGYIDDRLTPANAAYYPAQSISGETLALLGGQSGLEQELCSQAYAIFQNLQNEPWFDAQSMGVRAYIVYAAQSDTYICYYLY